MTERVRKLEGVQVVIFDAYGTLFDVTSPVTRQQAVLGDKTDLLARLWRSKQLEYTWIRSLVGEHADFWRVTRDALDYSLESLGIFETGLADELMADTLVLDKFPDVDEALLALKSRGRRLAILSNGSPSMLDSLLRNAGLDKTFEHVLSVEDVGIYKPSRRVYRMAMQKFGVQGAASICFVSGNGWDAHGAAQFGFQAVQIMRHPAADDRLPGTLAGVVESLGQVVAML